MNKQKTTKRALLSSVCALFLCFAMLLGSTFAWFTDSAISSGNKIVTGNLDVDLYQWTSATTSVEITENKEPVFDPTILWEPNRTEVVYLSIKNNGSLALKYKVALNVYAIEKNLIDVMSYQITPDATFGTVTEWAGVGTRVEEGTNATQANDVTLLPGEEHFFALSVHMDELAGNEYMNGSITFDIKVLAGQLAHEEDSFGKTYDAFADYPGTGVTPAITGSQSAAEIIINNENGGTTGSKVGSVIIPAAAADPDATQYSASIEKSEYKPNITIAANAEHATYDVTIEGLKENNTTPVKVTITILPGLDPNTVKVYHYDTLIDSTYDPNTGYVTFESASFSPFTIEYDAESEYVAPVVNGRPTATVTYMDEYVGEDKIVWGNYGQWSPTAGLEANLEAAFKFACPDYKELTDDEKKVIDAYRYWYCDFYVSLNKDLGANQLFLGGNYGSFGWIGFHNGDLELEANTEIGLLESVTVNPWTYNDIESYVGTFICGVGDVNNALDGATFTVKLRLTNPEDANEYYDVNVVTYTFGAGYSIDGTVIGLTNDIDLNNPENQDWLQGLIDGN